MPPDLQPVAKFFEVPGVFAGASLFGNGHIHDTFLAQFRDGPLVRRAVLQRLNTAIFTDPDAVMENIRRVTAHLAARLPARETIALIPCRDGSLLCRDAEGGAWRAWTFAERSHSYEVCTHPRQAFEAARIVGRFQRLLADLPGPRLAETIPFFHHAPRRLSALEDAAAANAAGRAAEVEPELNFVLARRNLAFELVRRLEAGELPERVTHNDTKLNNVLFDDDSDRALCIVDLDTVMPGCALCDFGDMVRTMTCEAPEDERDLSKVGLDLARFEALVRGYVDGTGGLLTPAEIDGLVVAGRVLTLTIGIRFLTDHLAGDTYFKVHRPNHNLDRARAQFRLVRSMEEQEEKMRAVVSSIV